MDSHDTLEDVINGILEDEEMNGNKSDDEMEDRESENITVNVQKDETSSKWILIINSQSFECESVTRSQNYLSIKVLKQLFALRFLVFL